MTYLHAIILAIIEGVTEFLPISSTGHMIIGSSIMGIAQQEFTKLFTVAIQFGAILSVVVLYRRKFFQSVQFYLKLFVAFLPAAVVGKLFHHQIDAFLGNIVVVASSLLIGGVILLFVDNWFEETQEEETINYLTALKIGFFQTIAVIPGVSRSGATIVGGLSQRLTRKAAAEFSFFLGVPTLFVATVYKLYEFNKEGIGFTVADIKLLLIGNLIAFVVAMLAIRFLVNFLIRHGFKLFGWYRIAIGVLILALHFSGFQLHLF